MTSSPALASWVVGRGEKGVSLVRITTRRFRGNEKEDEDENDVVLSGQWANDAASLLAQQWPRGGDIDYYREKIVQHSSNNNNRLGSSTPSYELPCSLVLLEHNECIGHARLTECFESSGGNAAAVTFVVVSSTIRGRGFGSQLMALLEDQAKQLGYHYVYLWTKTAIPFYQKIGYVECQRVSLKRACLQSLDSRQVEGLEAILLSKKQKSDSMTKTTVLTTTRSQPKETILLPPGDDNNANEHSLPDVWLRKRLVEQVGSIRVPAEERIQELDSFLSDFIDWNVRAYWEWRYHFLSLPWQAQIGPSCGLAALRMVREYFLSLDANDYGDHNQPQQLPSLLGEAQERGFTQDGEIFDAKNLLELAKEFCGLEEANFSAEMMNTTRLNPQAVYQILTAGGVLILPYDSKPRTRFPTKRDGRSAHYGIVVGLLVGEAPCAGEEENDDGKGKSNSILLHELADPTEVMWNDKNHEILLLVQHSLSSKWSIAPWSDFLESNQQLERVDSEKFGADIRLDLKNRIIVFRRQSST